MVDSGAVRCYHCGLPVTDPSSFTGHINGQLRSFCCPACLAVAEMISGGGLESFYQFRTLSGQAAEIPAPQDAFAAFDASSFQKRYVRCKGQLCAVNLLIGGMHCAACVWLLERYLEKLPGVERVSVNLTDQRASIEWRDSELPLSEICRTISALGYQPEPYAEDSVRELQKKESHTALRRLGVAGIAMMQVGMFAVAMYAGDFQSMEQSHRQFMRWVSMLVSLPVVFYAAQPFFIGAWRGLKMKSPGMDVPVAVAIALAFLASCIATVSGQGDVYFDSVAMFTFLLLAARYFELRARHASIRYSSDLQSVLPSSVLKITSSGNAATGEQQLLATPLFDVNVGDCLLVKSGQIIPVDGVVEVGAGSVDESQLTGEFTPQKKSVGASVTAGSMNVGGSLTIRASATGDDLQIQKINQLMEQGRRYKPQLAQLADRIAMRFVASILAIAAVSFVFWWWFEPARAFTIMLSVLVVSCPCALSLATPAAITAGTNCLRSAGLLVTNAQVWEKLQALTDVVFDKTGTLTCGRLNIVHIEPLNTDQGYCLSVAAALEAGSEHPIASAFRGHARQILAHDLKVVQSQGVEGVVDGYCYRIGRPEFVADGGRKFAVPPGPDSNSDGQWILLAADRPMCWFLLSDQVRDDAEAVIASLQRRGLKTHLLSGDSSGSAENLSQKLGIDYCISGASAEQKLTYIKTLQEQGAKVAMLGDGINDIPVLAAADVSIAMANASDMAKTQADCISLSARLKSLLVLLKMARRTRQIVRQNLLWALCYNGLAIPLAFAGWVPPYAAAIGMSLSSVIVVVNALRLQRNHMSREDIDQPVQPGAGQ